MNEKMYDLLIIGGGINGAGIAVDAAGRGLSVALCEQEDLANGTSWKSSKLIHGGLRYLEYKEFNLVRKALREREVLLKKAPHIIHPLIFILPHAKHLRPAWLIWLGLFLYDHLGKRRILPSSHRVKFQFGPDNPLKNTYTSGFDYADCYADDSRLVILNAMQAREKGAAIFTRSEVQSAQRFPDHWQVTVFDHVAQKTFTLRAKVLINAAGPWGEKVLAHLDASSKRHLALIKGSHIVVPKLYPGNQAYILQQPDQRIVFVIPFEEKYSLIGTTDIPFQGDIQNVAISEEEITYLCGAVNYYFHKAIKPQDILWTYAGIRPLLQDESDNPSAITRDFSFELNTQNNEAPFLMILGGKLTTYRELAEEALQLLKPFFPHMGTAWTANAPLPGGDIANADFNAFYQQFKTQFAWLPSDLALRYAHNYGTKAYQLLENSKNIGDLGEHFANGLYAREVDYLVQQEWAQNAEDILWRRSKLGLGFTAEATARLNQYLQHTANT